MKLSRIVSTIIIALGFLFILVVVASKERERLSPPEKQHERSTRKGAHVAAGEVSKSPAFPALPRVSISSPLVGLILVLSFLVGFVLWGSAQAQFDGAPSAPQPLSLHPEFANWDVQVHQRSGWMQGENEYIKGTVDHGPNCEPPPATHQNGTFSGNVFVCANHVMTFADGDGYGLTVLTPNQLVDLSGGRVVVQFNMSTFRTSARDWVELRFTPWEDNLTLPGEIGDVDLQGDPKRDVDFVMGQHPCSRGLCSDWNLHTDDTSGSLNAEPSPSWHDISGFVPDKARRDKFEIILTANHVKFWMPDYGLVFYDRDVPRLSWTKGVFQLEHHAYTPEKGQCIDNCPDSLPGGTTWHWDEVHITPNVPFSITHATERSFVSETDQGSPGPSHCFDFTDHSSQNAFLRFSAFAEVDVDFGCDGGWQRVEPQVRRSGAVKSFFVPAPPGITKVAFRLWRRNEATWDSTPQYVRDITFWSMGVGSGSTASATATTSVSPTSTRTPTTTASPTRTATPTPTSTASQAPTGTATNSPSRTPTATLTRTATVQPTLVPTQSPTPMPTETPTQTIGVSWTGDNTPGTLGAAEVKEVTLSFKNTGSDTWFASGANPVRLSYHWRVGACSGIGVAVWDGMHTALPTDVTPGSSVSNLAAEVKAPAPTGTYCLQFDLVSEGLEWFSAEGASVLSKTVKVTASTAEYDVLWTNDDSPDSAKSGSTLQVRLSLTNTGSDSWNATGANPVLVGYHWRNGACDGNDVAVWDGNRTELPGDVPSGDAITNLKATVQVPPTPGIYCLQFDLVKEGVTWLSSEGADVLNRTVAVR